MHRRAVPPATAAAWVLIALLGALAYANSLDAPFVFDDVQNIVSNPAIRLSDLSPASLARAAFDSPLDRPLASLSFALNYAAGGLHVRGFHAVNVAIHLLNGLLVFALASSLLATRSSVPAERVPRAALFVALVFVTHPVQTQAVTYVVQRMTSLATFFVLLSLWLYLKGRGGAGRTRLLWWAGAAAAWVLGLGAKEIAAPLPLAILLVEWLRAGGGVPARRTWLPILAGIAVFAAIGLVYLGPDPLHKILAGYAKRDFTPGERLLTQLRVVVFYGSLLLWPLPSRLNLVHAFPTSHSLLDPPTTLLCGLLLLAVGALAIALARRQPMVSFCVGWMVLFQLIESTVIPVEMIYEHRLYLPLFGFALLLGDQIFARLPLRAATALATVLVVSLAGATFVRNQTWRDRVTLWSDVAAKNPGSHRVRNNLGTALQEEGRVAEAIEQIEIGIRLAPRNAALRSNLGLALERSGRLPEAIAALELALRLDPGDAAAHNNLGIALERADRLEEAVPHFTEALRLDPGYAEAWYNLGRAFDRRDRLEEAARYYGEAIRTRPDFAAAHNNLGRVRRRQGRLAEAESHYRDAIRADPHYAHAWNNLGMLLSQAGRLDEAIDSYREALRLDPDYAYAHNNLGVAHARRGELDAAIASFERALSHDPDYTEARRNLEQARALLAGPRAR